MSKIQAIFIPDPHESTIAPQEAYFAVRMVRAHLREGLFRNNRYPVVHATLNFSANDGIHEVAYVTAPKLPEKVFNDPKRILVKNVTILPETLYWGGEIGFSFNLISLPGVDITRPLLDLIGDMTSILNIPGSVVVSLAKSVQQAMNDVLHLRDATLIMGTDDTFGQQGVLQSGALAVIQADREIDLTELAIVNDLLCVQGDPLDGADYFIIRFDRIAELSNWHLLPDINQTYRTLASAIGQGLRGKELDEPFQAFRNAVLGSVNLNLNDKKRIVLTVHKGIMESFASTEGLSLDTARGDLTATTILERLDRMSKNELASLMQQYDLLAIETLGLH